MHAENVARMSANLARLIGYNKKEMSEVYLGAYLHDIGKEFVPNAVIEKVNPLTRPEFNKIRCHPLVGYIYLRQHISSKIILNTVLYHHEYLNGTGYPCGLKGDKIPMEARICTVADVWDALLSNRCYHKAWNTTRALELIWAGSGTQFDPDVVSLFLKMIEHREIANRHDTNIPVKNLRSGYHQFIALNAC